MVEVPWLRAEWGEINEHFHRVWSSKYLTDNNHCHGFSGHRNVVLWTELGNFQTEWCDRFHVGVQLRQSGTEDLFVFLNSNFYGPTSFSYIFYTAGAGNAVYSSIV